MIEVNKQMIDDADLPLEDRIYEHGKNIFECKDPSFFVICFYNVSKENQDFVDALLKQFNFKLTSKHIYTNKVVANCYMLD